MKKFFTILFLFALTPFVWSQQLHVVETVGSTGFSPTNVTVSLGDTVRWVNTGGGHNVNASQTIYPDNPASFGNAVGVGWTFDHVFTVPGFYNYQCDPHLGLGMVGTVTVLNGPAYSVGLVTGDADGNGEADSVGVACSITGVVYGIDMQGGGNIQFTVIDASNDGIGVFSSGFTNYVVTEGDEVTMDGTVSSFNGLAQFSPDTVIVNSSGNTLLASTVVTALDESTESQLVTLQNVTLVDPSQWDNAGSNNIDVTDGTNTWTVRIDSDVADLNAAPAPTGAFNITGLGGQFDSSDPYLDGYQLLPRYLSDLENIVVAGALDIGTVTADSDMNGEADSVGVSGSITGVVYGIDMQGGGNIQFTVIDANNNGIGVFSSSFTNYVVTEGDEVTMEGTVGSFNGLAQFSPDTVIVNSVGNTLFAPTVVLTLDESTESQLVTLQNVTLVNPAQWDNAGSNNIDVTDGTNTWTVRIDSDVVDLNAAPVPTGAFNITGLGGQFDSSDPYLDGYQLLPRYLADLDLIVPVVSGLIITGVADPQGANATGGTQFGPRAIELYALEDIADMSIYGIGSANNGGGTDSVEFSFPAIALTAGDCITLCDSTLEAKFLSFFGVAPTILVPGSVTGINGNDAIELFKDGEVVDVFGDINTDGSGEAWEYTDGWAYRKPATGPDGSNFILGNWTYSGVDALQSNVDSVNTLFANPFPLCTYSPNPPAVLTAMDDDVNLPIDVASNIDILGNDDIPNTITAINIITMPTSGTVTVNGTTDITYTPNMGFCGTDVIVYEICEMTTCSQASVNITIDCPPSYPPYTIGTVTGDSDGDFVADSLGVLCEVTGVVHNPDFRGGGGYTFTVIGADGNGIAVFEFDDVDGYTDPAEGDELTLRGEIGTFNGLIQFRPAEIVLNSTGNALVTPTDVTMLGEETESQLIKMYNMEIVDPTQWLGGGASFNVDITDGTNTFAMRIDNDSELSSAPVIVGVFNVTGIGGQFDDEDPRDAGYQIFPRYSPDIEEVSSTVNPALAENITLQPNPVSDVLQIRSEIKIDQIRITNMLGQQVTELRQPNLNETINVNNWQSGIYVITFVTGDEIWATQFVKQ